MKKIVRYITVLTTALMSTTPVFAAMYGQVATNGAVAYNIEHKVTSSMQAGEQFQITDVLDALNVYQLTNAGMPMMVNKDNVFIRKVIETVQVEGVKVRTEPNPESDIIKTMSIGEQVSVMHQTPNGNWYQVILQDGQEGFIYKSQLVSEGLTLLPVKDFSKPKVEEIQWSEASRVLARGDVAIIEDVYTGKTFEIKRTFGTNHADVEALTKQDTAMVKEIWGGFTWERRPVIVHVDGRRLAASLSGMPHAGGSLDAVPNNGMSGVMDLHFRGSRKHAEGHITATTDPLHQNAITIAAQYK